MRSTSKSVCSVYLAPFFIKDQLPQDYKNRKTGERKENIDISVNCIIGTQELLNSVHELCSKRF